MSDGNDIIIGSWRGDRIDAGAGNDIVLGGWGNDVLDGGAGNDIVAGGRGHDVLIYRAPENRGDHDLYLGGRGCDTLVMVLSADMACDPALQAEIQAFNAQAAWAPFHFETLGLTVHSVENLYVHTLPPEEPRTQAPVLTDDALTVVEGSAARTIDLLANDEDPDGTALTVTGIDATGLVGEFTDNGDGTVTFAPGGAFDALAEGETAEQTITYTVTDGDGETATATLTITVEGTNDAPVVGAVDLGTIDEDTSVSFSAADLIANATDVDNELDADSVTSVSVDGVALEAVDGTFTFVPPADFDGEVTVDFAVSDGIATVDATASITVAAVNDAPEAVNAAALVDEDAIASGQLVATDVDSEDLTFTLDAPVDGLTLAADGSYTFDASDEAYRALGEGDVLEVSASFTVSDGAASDTGTLTIGVTGRNEAPEASDDFISTVPVDTAIARGEPFTVHVDRSNEQEDPRVTALADGGFVVVYEGNDVDGNGVFARRFDAAGNALGEEFQVNTVTPYSQDWADVTALADGGFVVTWESTSYDVDWRIDENAVSELSVRARRYEADGTPVGDEFVVSEVEEGDQPRIATLENGTFVVVWESNDNQGLFARVYGADAEPLGEQFRMNGPDETAGGENPTVTPLADGGFVAAWERSSNLPLEQGPVAQRFDADGNPVGEAFELSSDPSFRADKVELTTLSDGGFVAVWETSIRDPESGFTTSATRARIFDADGSPRGENIELGNDSDRAPSVTALPDGGFVVTREGDDGLPDIDILGQRYDADGNEVGERFIVAGNDPESFPADELDMTTLANGDIVVTFERFAPVEGEPTDNDSFAQIFTFNAQIGEDGPNFISAEQLVANDSDFDGDDFRVTSVQATGDTQGNVALSPDGSTILYFAGPDFPELEAGETATDTFSYTITDANGLTDTATVTVEVQGMDDFGV